MPDSYTLHASIEMWRSKFALMCSYVCMYVCLYDVVFLSSSVRSLRRITVWRAISCVPHSFDVPRCFYRSICKQTRAKRLSSFETECECEKESEKKRASECRRNGSANWKSLYCICKMFWAIDKTNNDILFDEGTRFPCFLLFMNHLHMCADEEILLHINQGVVPV